jgi:hypothetical protein
MLFFFISSFTASTCQDQCMLKTMAFIGGIVADTCESNRLCQFEAVRSGSGRNLG